MLRTLALVLAALLAYAMLMAGLIWLLVGTAPSLVGWLDAALTPDGTRAIPVAVTGVLGLVAYGVWLARRDGRTRRSSSG